MKNLLNKTRLSMAAGLAAVGQFAYADLPATVTAQITDTQADITEAGALIIALAVVAMGIRWVKATFF